ncbi:organic cation transporter protein-like [Branchiostoma lanceolatum]|uniref:organic cation transporter protein-like n=1 Tax=Branchiostoma lanceolatum TaxID=7740 RepID=UPI0034517E13
MEYRYRRIIHEIGEFGRFQKSVAFCLAVLAVPHAMHVLSMAFLGALPEHHCRLPAVSTPDDFPPSWQDQLGSFNGSIPLELDASGESGRYSRCQQFNLTDGLNGTSENRTLQHCTDGWVYDRSHYGTSIVTQFDLVCDRAWLREFAQSVHMLGFSFGAITSGTLSDRYGRRPTLLWCIFLLVAFSVTSAFSPNYIVFVILKFLLGAVNVSIYYTAFVLGMEVLDHSKHTMFGMSMYLFLVLGYIVLGALAYIIRDWWKLQLAISAPFLLCLSYWWLLPESPRWLIVTGRMEDAKRAIKRAARMNGADFPDKLYREMDSNLIQNDGNDEKGRREHNLLDLVRTPNIRKNTLIVGFTWFVMIAVYFGLSLGAPELPGDPYVNFIVGSCMEIVAVVVAWSTMDRWGRKPPVIAAFIVAGISCGATAVVPKELWQVSTGLSMVGKLGVSVTYAIFPVYSAEVFPTVVRNMGIGVVSMIGRAGGILAPFVALLAEYWAPLPLLTFGILSFLDGVAILALPETLGVPLPNTLEDSENLNSVRGKSSENSEKILPDEFQKTEETEIYDRITVL